MGESRHTLNRLCGLDALVKGAAVGDAAEDARNVLRIIGIAEAQEDLILLAGVVVATHVKCVLVFEQMGAAGVGSQPGVRKRIETEQFDAVGIDPPAGDLIQAARVEKVVVPGPQVPNGSRT